ncbi:MAG: retroviral-like aspartic protease family protein [Bacteroidetes bacterium]|nr:retroviral-like aspartic protease family protein [Bacteroidota bacterium]
MKHQIPLNIISIEDEGFHLFVEGTLNGFPLLLLVDTGASRSVFDKQKISEKFPGGLPELIENEKLSTGLGTTTMQSQSVILDSFSIGSLKISDYQAVVMEMSHVNESYAHLDLPGIDGVIGSDILMNYRAVINYKKKILVLRDNRD